MTDVRNHTMNVKNVSAENPFTIRADHRMEDFDPETPSGRGTDTRGTSSISLGVNLTF